MLNNTRLKLNLEENEKSEGEENGFKRTGKRFLTNQKFNVDKNLIYKVDTKRCDTKNDRLDKSKEDDEVSKSRKSESIELESEEDSDEK